MPTFYVHNLGCKVNRVQADAIVATLLAAGAVPVDANEAEVIVVNSCTVTAEADTKTRKAVRQALRAPHACQVVVTGCAAAVSPAIYEALDARVTVEPDKMRAASIASRFLGLDEEEVPSPSSLHVRAGAVFPTRMGIMVQDGCDNACTYCIVHTARGASTSRPVASIVDEVKAAAAAGVREVVLTGINIGSYRADEGGLVDLVGLLRRLLAQTDIARIRISSIEPLDVTAGLIETMAAAGERICTHLHMPLQSGSDRILADMDRPYRAAAYREIVEQARAGVPGIALTTDVIVGFPGERDEDFEATCALCRTTAFSKIHIFRYSPRQGTPAADRDDQVDPTLKKERVQRLVVLERELRAADRYARTGRVESVLIERAGYGKSSSYHDVIDGGAWGSVDRCVPGSLVDMRLDRVDGRGRFIGIPVG
jgi:threonylcarbamoyladenosine tRNA methylthiotransferase MtaB